VTGLQLSNFCPHSLSEEAFQIGINRVVLCGDDVPGGNGLPGSSRDGFGEYGGGYGFLGHCHDGEFAVRYVCRENFAKLGPVDVKEPGRVRNQSGRQARRRIQFDQCLKGLAAIGSECRNVNESLYIRARGARSGDDRPSVGMADQDNVSFLRLKGANGRRDINQPAT
jgi:hypothetical protein